MYITKKLKNNIVNVRNIIFNGIKIIYNIIGNIIKNSSPKSYLLLFLNEKNLPSTNWELIGQLLLSPFKIFWIINLWIIGNCVRLHGHSGYLSYNFFRDEKYRGGWRNEKAINFEAFYITFAMFQLMNWILITIYTLGKIFPSGNYPELENTSSFQLIQIFFIMTIFANFIPLIISLIIGAIIFIYIQVKNLFKYIIIKTTRTINWY